MLKDNNILYIIHNYNNFQKDPIEELSRYFKKVYVLVRYKPISKIVRYLPFKSLKKYEDSYVVDLSNVPDNVEVIRTPVWYLPFGIFYKWAGYLHYKAVKRAIKKYNIKFDLIHCHFTWTAGYVGMRLKEEYKKPFIVTGHGFDVYDLSFQGEHWRKKVGEILDSADKVITVSEKNRDLIQEISDKEAIVIGNGFNMKLFYPMGKDKVREELGIEKEKKVLLSVGNLEKVKGHKYLIDAVSILRKKCPDILCYIIGGGSMMDTLAKRIKRLGLENNVFLMGHVLHGEVNKWMNACDLFVLPSLAESFGIVQIEAFACGKPVVATKNDGSKKVVTSEDYGLLCEVGVSEDLGNKVDQGLKKDWERKKIIKYSEGFRQREISESLVEVYQKILKK